MNASRTFPFDGRRAPKALRAAFGALAFTAAALLALLPICAALEAHAAAAAGHEANSCCLKIEGTPSKAPSIAAGTGDGHATVEPGALQALLLSGPLGLRVLAAAFAARPRSFYARSSRILR